MLEEEMSFEEERRFFLRTGLHHRSFFLKMDAHQEVLANEKFDTNSVEESCYIPITELTRKKFAYR